jgi:Thioredoxin
MKRERSWEGVGLEVLRISDFESTRLKRPGTYAVCFGATWCRPTRRFVPKFVAQSGRLPAKLAVADITDLHDPLWDSFQIKITPTIIVFRAGSPVGRFDGRRFFGLGDSDLERMGELVRKHADPTAGNPTFSPDTAKFGTESVPHSLDR